MDENEKKMTQFNCGCGSGGWRFYRAYTHEFVLVSVFCGKTIEARSLLDLNRLFDGMVPQEDGTDEQKEKK